MPTREEVLKEETNKGVDTIEQRVYYTLHGHNVNATQTHRTMKAIALLMNHLHQQGILNEDAIDDILFEVVGGG